MAKRVKAYRKSLKKTQLEFAIEREKANPSLSTIQKFAAHMGITVSALLAVEEDV